MPLGPTLSDNSDISNSLHAASKGRIQPSKPTNIFTRVVASITAVGREASYYQYTPLSAGQWFKLPPLGVTLLLFSYLGFILALEFISNNYPGATHYTALGVRAGWLAIAQIPLLILLAGKNNIIGLVTGISYERLNVYHRWVSRGLLLLATLHFGYQSVGWNEYGLMQLEWTTDSCPPTGIAAYVLLLWLNLSTLAPIRNLWYEFFVVQHIITFFGFIIAIMYHLPSTALYSRVYIWIPIGLYVLDRIIRSTRWGMYNIKPARVIVKSMEGGVTKIRMRNSKLKRWSPGSYVLLSIPEFGFAQSHPATIASTPSSHNGDLIFILKGHGGFTKRVFESASDDTPLLDAEAAEKSHKSFIDGPYGGSHSDFACFDTAVLVAGSTGVSFCLPILLDIANRASKTRLPVRAVHFIWIVKSVACVSWISAELKNVFASLRSAGVEVQIKVFITCDDGMTEYSGVLSSGCKCKKVEGGPCCCTEAPRAALEDIVNAEADVADEKHTVITAEAARTNSDVDEKTPAISPSRRSSMTVASGRPAFYDLLWDVLDEAQGETGIAVCGPLGLSTTLRSTVVKLSDQRAVHKGSGAQGIYLHVEGFAW